MTGTILPIALGFAFVCVSLSILLNLFRLWRGPLSADRILAVDTLTINAIAMIVLFGIAYTTAAYFEAALLLPCADGYFSFTVAVYRGREAAS